jgi:hypothetical protein
MSQDRTELRVPASEPVAASIVSFTRDGSR